MWLPSHSVLIILFKEEYLHSSGRASRKKVSHWLLLVVCSLDRKRKIPVLYGRGKILEGGLMILTKKAVDHMLTFYCPTNNQTSQLTWVALLILFLVIPMWALFNNLLYHSCTFCNTLFSSFCSMKLEEFILRREAWEVL